MNIPFKHIGLFEGIGGFSLAAKSIGWQTIAWCERYRAIFVAYSDLFRQIRSKEREKGFDFNEGRTPQRNFNRNVFKKDVTYPKGIRQIRDRFPQVLFGEKKKGNRRPENIYFPELFNKFREFPTQSPVFRGNDGLSDKLLRAYVQNNCGSILSEKEIDKIISEATEKFRQEAISGYGNAVVPDLIVKIFKAIQEYEISQNE